MDRVALLAYVGSLVILFCKGFVVTLVQGKVRFASRTFRWPEDAGEWRGSAAEGPEHETIERAQAALRNDGETQPFFYVFGGLWVVLGVPGGVALGVLVAYALARCAHSFFLLRPKQPLRNRAFAVGQLLLMAIIVDVTRRALGAL